MKKYGLAALTGAAALLPISAFAASPDYTYLKADYIVDGEQNLDLTASNNLGSFSGSDESDYDGLNLGGSIALTPNAFVLANYSDLDADDSDSELLSGGIGINGPLGAGDVTLDAYGTLTYESIESDIDGLNDDIEADGFGVTGGLRWMATPMLEINPHVGYVDYGSIDGLSSGADADLDGWRFGVDGLYSVNEQFAITAAYRTTKLDIEGNVGNADLDGDLDMENEIRVGVRVYFAGLQ